MQPSSSVSLSQNGHCQHEVITTVFAIKTPNFLCHPIWNTGDNLVKGLNT